MTPQHRCCQTSSASSRRGARASFATAHAPSPVFRDDVYSFLGPEALAALPHIYTDSYIPTAINTSAETYCVDLFQCFYKRIFCLYRIDSRKYINRRIYTMSIGNLQ